jgi:ubiquinone/menaquinone biosynthesis C-methylase UbiE
MSAINSRVEDSLYSRLFAKVYDPVMRKLEERVLLRYRKQLLSGLSGHVLEVGSGTGVNFPLYPKGCHIIASEPSEHMLRLAQQRSHAADVRADIRLVMAGVGSTDLAAMIPEEGLDAVVCTLVLCTIPDPVAAVRDFKRWLKPEGKLIVLEHVHAHNQPRRMLHALLNPAWKVLAEGCNLTRETPDMLKQEGFVPESEEQFTKVLPFYVAVLRSEKH